MNLCLFSIVCLISMVAPLYGQCDSLSIDPKIVLACNRQIETYKVSKFLSDVTYPLIPAIPASMIVNGLQTNDNETKNAGIALLAIEASTYGLVYLLKNTVNRDRPFRRSPLCITAPYPDEEKSFPSGHAATTSAMTVFLALHTKNAFVFVPSALYTSYIFYARMNLGMHYPTDILAGAIIGSTLAYLGNEILEKNAKHNVGTVGELKGKVFTSPLRVINLSFPF